MTHLAHAIHHPPPPPRLRKAIHQGRPLRVAGEPQLASDLMTRQVFTIGPDDTLVNLEEQMEEFHFRHLPVVEGNVLVGLISRSDLLHVWSSRVSKSAAEENLVIQGLPAWRVMRQELVTVRPDEPLANVAWLIWEVRVGCVPVTEEDGTLLGIITEGDFVRLAHSLLRQAGRGREDTIPERADQPKSSGTLPITSPKLSPV